MFKSQLLYQLSYAGARVIVFAESSSACRRGHGRPPALLSKLLSNPKTVVKPHGLRTGKLREVSGPRLRRHGHEVASERSLEVFLEYRPCSPPPQLLSRATDRRAIRRAV